MEQQKTEVEASAQVMDDRIKKLKVCTHMPYISIEVNFEKLVLSHYY